MVYSSAEMKGGGEGEKVKENSCDWALKQKCVNIKYLFGNYIIRKIPLKSILLLPGVLARHDTLTATTLQIYHQTNAFDTVVLRVFW